jgi:hypothetical protein
MDAKRNFILQQGLDSPVEESCPIRFSALMFQPRVVGSIVLLAVVLQSPTIFLILSGVLWWSALLPRLNPFDAVYNGSSELAISTLPWKPVAFSKHRST